MTLLNFQYAITTAVKPFTAGALALGLAFSPMAAANADDAGNMNLAEKKTRDALVSAMNEAANWSEANPTGVAIAVYLGNQSSITEQQIREVLTADFKANGVENIVFFVMQNNQPANGFTLHANGMTFGVYTIADVRKNVALAAGQARLAAENPVFANTPESR